MHTFLISFIEIDIGVRQNIHLGGGGGQTLPENFAIIPIENKEFARILILHLPESARKHLINSDWARRLLRPPPRTPMEIDTKGVQKK